MKKKPLDFEIKKIIGITALSILLIILIALWMIFGYTPKLDWWNVKY